MSRSAPQPRSRKTPTGGRRTAKMILIMSLRSRVLADGVANLYSQHCLIGTYDPVKGMMAVVQRSVDERCLYLGGLR